MSLAPNQQLFEYRIVRVLGQGAFGTVYLAHDTLLDRPVAIKELTVTAQTDEVAFKRFLQEARAAGGLNHPHVVTIHALKVVEPNVYLVMEYLAGGSLRGLLEKHSPLPVDEAVRIAADVCEGLAVAHAKGIVHRDVKPENVLLTEEGRAKVGDFGIAHVPRGAGGTSLTQAGFQPGTLLYMSPEQIRGQRVDGRSDVYQVGALLYEMLTGRHYVDLGALERRARETAGSNAALFQARLYELLAEAVCEWEPGGVRGAWLDLPTWVGEVTAAALAKEVEERPTAEGLAQALRVRKTPRGFPTESIRPASIPKGETLCPSCGRRVREGTLFCPQCGVYLPSLHATDLSAMDSTWAAKHRKALKHYDLGVAYLQQNRLNEVVLEMEAALRLYPDYAEAHYILGMAYSERGSWDEAIREYQAALRIDPNYTEAHVNLGLAYLQQGRLDDAIHEYQAALRINPDYAKAHFNLALAYRKQGQMDDAIREYQAALCISPNFAEAHFGLGLAYKRQGRLDEAIRELQVAAQSGYQEARALLVEMSLL